MPRRSGLLLRTTKPIWIVALIAACLLLACGHKKHMAPGVGTTSGDAGGMKDAGPKDAAEPPLLPQEPPPKPDAGHPATKPPPPASDEDAGPHCTNRECRALSTECSVGSCDPVSGECKFEAKPDGTVCGSQVLDNCTTPDTCQAGLCAPNDRPQGTPCGDQNKDCHFDDACDGQGQCTDNGVKRAGTACGDTATDTECDKRDSCDADGVCQPNYAAVDAPCGDHGKLCNIDDACDGQGKCIDNGVWTPGHCPPGSKDEAGGCLCGVEALSVCQFAVDVCVAGTCVLGHEPDGKPCGDTTTNTECDKPDACLAGVCSPHYEATGTTCGDRTTNTTCDRPDSCDGAGSCGHNYASSITTCGSAAGECFLEPLCNGAGTCQASAPVTSGTMCGSQTDTACNHADTCDGAGGCLQNLAAGGAMCGDSTSTQCNGPDSCDGAGACQSNFARAGSACGDQGKTCLKDDACDGSGTCTDNGLAVPCAFHGNVFGNGTGLPGVLVEILGSNPASTTTASDGTFTLGVPAFGQLLFHVADTTGYFGDVELRTLAPADGTRSLDFNLLPDGNLTFPASAAGITPDTAKGVVLVSIDGTGLTGAEGATLSAASANPIAQVSGNWQYSATTTSSSGGTLLFYNVAVGTTTVTPVSGVGQTCTVDAPAATRFPVMTHTLSRVHVGCH
jgi:hypothetical protein